MEDNSRFRKWRKRLDMNIWDLAERSGVSTATISLFERGHKVSDRSRTKIIDALKSAQAEDTQNIILGIGA